MIGFTSLPISIICWQCLVKDAIICASNTSAASSTTTENDH